MIASYRYGFIFIKTRKTASTSIELALSEHCGPDDILTTLGKNGIKRALRGVFPRNYSRSPELEAEYASALRASDRGKMRAVHDEIIDRGGLWAHVGAARVREWVGEEFWNKTYKFTSERHPYFKAVSLARHAYRHDRPFPEHLSQVIDGMDQYVGHKLYMSDGKVLIDAFVRQESLEQDMADVARRCGMPPLTLPRARDDRSDDTSDVVHRLTPEQRQRIYEKCAPEFELFGWER